MKTTIDAFVFKHLGAILRVLPAARTSYTTSGKVVAREGATFEFNLEYAGQIYPIKGHAVLAVSITDAAKGIVQVSMEQHHIGIPAGLSPEVLSFLEIEHTLTYSYAPSVQ
jgi:hypothetical protein